MAKQIINIGSGQNEGDGGDTRLAFEKINSNFDELYAGGVQTLTLVGTTLAISGGNQVTLDNVFEGGLTADVTGSVFADDSTLLVDGVNGRIVAPVFANVTGDTAGTHTGPVIGNVTGNADTVTNGVYTTGNATITGVWQFNQSIAADVVGIVTGSVNGSLTGVMSGSVFGDDSTLLVDGINNRLVMANNTTDDLAEGSNNKYFTNGRAIAMTIVFG